MSGPLLTDEEAADLAEITRLLDEAYRHYFELSDGHCKSAEGHVSVSFGNYWQRQDGPRTRLVEVYSYVLGPNRRHYFNSIKEAVTAVQSWHADEMATFCYECDGTTDHEADCWYISRRSTAAPVVVADLEGNQP